MPTPKPDKPIHPVTWQSGITNRPPEHLVLAAFTLDATDPAQARDTVEQLRAVEQRELRSDLDAENETTPKDVPPPETGELGFADNYDRRHLTITTGFSSTGYDKLAITGDERPQDLQPIPWNLLGDSPAQPDQGDIVLQICSDDIYVCEHVAHRIEHALRDRLTLLWTQIGSQRYSTREGRTSRGEGRAVNGFIDGTSNLDPRHDTNDQRLVFVDPDDVPSYPQLPTEPPPGYGGTPSTAFPADLRPPPAHEPPTTKFGTYMVVRSSVISLEPWDDSVLAAQEATIGRFKYSGAFLDLADDPNQLNAPPAFAANQADERVPVDAHARKANPRRPEDSERRLFRRGYPLIAGTTTSFDRGLVFVAFGRTISTQFEFVFRAWMRNPNFPREGAGADRLFSFEKATITGGYYFVPPLAHRNQPWSWILPE
jgi:deferrochelatase/peroxidase EfeB